MLTWIAFGSDDSSMGAAAIGTTIRKRRQVLGMTQQQLADQLGVSKSTVANWEIGKHFPLRYLGAIEEALGVSLDGGGGPAVFIPPELERRLARLTEDERAYVVELLTRPRGAAPAGDAEEAPA